MAKPNYAYAKYRRDLAKKKKKEEKKRLKSEARLQKKLEGTSPDAPEEESSDVESQSNSEPPD